MPPPGSSSSVLRTARGRGVLQAHDSLAGRTVHHAAGAEQPGLERRPDARAELQHHARVERGASTRIRASSAAPAETAVAHSRARTDSARRRHPPRRAPRGAAEKTTRRHRARCWHRRAQCWRSAASPARCRLRARICRRAALRRDAAAAARAPARRSFRAAHSDSPTRLSPSNVGVPHPYRDCSSPTGSVNSFGSASQSKMVRTCSTWRLRRIRRERPHRDDAEQLQEQEADRRRGCDARRRRAGPSIAAAART